MKREIFSFLLASSRNNVLSGHRELYCARIFNLSARLYVYFGFARVVFKILSTRHALRVYQSQCLRLYCGKFPDVLGLCLGRAEGKGIVFKVVIYLTVEDGTVCRI